MAEISWCLQIEQAKFAVHTDDVIYCQQAWIRHFHTWLKFTTMQKIQKQGKSDLSPMKMKLKIDAASIYNLIL